MLALAVVFASKLMIAFAYLLYQFLVVNVKIFPRTCHLQNLICWLMAAGLLTVITNTTSGFIIGPPRAPKPPYRVDALWTNCLCCFSTMGAPNCSSSSRPSVKD
jgi:hypothetical protein